MGRLARFEKGVSGTVPLVPNTQAVAPSAQMSRGFVTDLTPRSALYLAFVFTRELHPRADAAEADAVVEIGITGSQLRLADLIGWDGCGEEGGGAAAPSGGKTLRSTAFRITGHNCIAIVFFFFALLIAQSAVFGVSSQSLHLFIRTMCFDEHQLFTLADYGQRAAFTALEMHKSRKFPLKSRCCCSSLIRSE